MQPSQSQPVRASKSAPIADAVLPTPLQSILFETILCPDTDLPQHWGRLRSALAATELDGMSVQFLPLLQRRLMPGKTDPLSQNIRARYRQTWATNQLLFYALRSCLETLHTAGVRTLLLKGAALTAGYYRDLGARAMGDFDVLVPHTEFEQAVTALTAAGWTTLYPLSTFDPRFTHAVPMVDAKGNSLDLHTRVLHLDPRKSIDELFWQSSVPLAIQNNAVQDTMSRGLCSADLILHLAIHGLRWSDPPQLRWIPDIATVLCSGPIHWDRLLCMTCEASASLAVSTALEYLAAKGFAQVPDHVLASLRSMPVDARQRRLFELGTRNVFGSFRDTLNFHWSIMTQQHETEPLLQKLRLLPAYFAYRRKMRRLETWTGFLGRDGISRHLKGKFNRRNHPSADTSR